MFALTVFLALVAVPIAEIVVLIEIGGLVGVVPTIGLILLTAVAGTALIRRQGIALFATLRRELDEGRPPVGAVIDGAFLLIAGVLLLTPGFLTDAVGFALLVPGVRRLVAAAAAARFMASARLRTARRTGGESGPREGDVVDGVSVEIHAPGEQEADGSPWQRPPPLPNDDGDGRGPA